MGIVLVCMRQPSIDGTAAVDRRQGSKKPGQRPRLVVWLRSDVRCARRSERAQQLGCRPSVRRQAETLLFLLNGDACPRAEDAVNLSDVVTQAL